MISVVCVYNDIRAFETLLLASLKQQTVKYQLIALENTQHRWTSAASALNRGGRLATGRYIMFVHQDIEFGSPTYLEEAERWLDSIPGLGIAGAIGMSENGKTYDERLRGFISNCGQDWGKPISKPEPVQTIDECVLIIPRAYLTAYPFDETTFDGWHCYGCDYALSVNERGQGAYIIPGYVYHRSMAQNLDKLRTYHRRLFFKHHRHYARIHATTNGLTWVSMLYISAIPVLGRWNAKLFPSWTETAKRELAGCDSLLDLGCGFQSQIGQFQIPRTVGVDAFEPYVIESKKKAIHTDCIHADLRSVEFQDKSFDAIFCSEVLEHLPYNEGAALLKKMDRWARKKIVITTPSGWWWQQPFDHNPYQQHVSGWSATDLRGFGYRVQGMSGIKWIRGYHGQLKNPAFFWARVASISEIVTRPIPELAFQLLAIKDVR
jgi:hypothetical protein